MGIGSGESRRPRGERVVLVVIACLTAVMSSCGATSVDRSAPATTPSPGPSAPASVPPSSAGTTSTTQAPVVDPAARGPFQVGHVAKTFVQPTDENRSLETDILYPVDAATKGPAGQYDLKGVTVAPAGPMLDAAPAAAGRFPLVVFSHGQGGIRLQSTFFTEVLASHGFVVASLDHPGDNFVDAFLAEADIPKFRRLRPQDVSAVIDSVLALDRDGGAPFSGHVDADRIGTSGHSFGGYTALATLTGNDALAPGMSPFSATLADRSFEGDPRVKAVLSMAGNNDLPMARLKKVTAPVMVLDGTLDANVSSYTSERAYEDVSSPVRYLANITDATHYSFTGICELQNDLTGPQVPEQVRLLLTALAASSCTAPILPPGRGHDLMNTYAVAFFAAHLAGDDRYRPYLTAREGATAFDPQHPPPPTTMPPVAF